MNMAHMVHQLNVGNTLNVTQCGRRIHALFSVATKLKCNPIFYNIIPMSTENIWRPTNILANFF